MCICGELGCDRNQSANDNTSKIILSKIIIRKTIRLG
jgi:hypothetical protein